MRNFYHRLHDSQRILFWIVTSSVAAFLLSTPCFAFRGLYTIPCGILLGGLISVLNFFFLIKQADGYVRTSHPKVRAVGFVLARFALYAIGLAVALLLAYFGYAVFEVFAVFGAYLLSKAVIMMYGFCERRDVV